MEGKDTTKISVSTLLLLIAIIVIAVMGCFIYKLNKDKVAQTQRANELQTQLSSLDGTVSNLQGKMDAISEIINDDSKTSETSETSGNATSKNTSSNQKWNGDITTIDMSNLKKDGVQYEELSSLVSNINYVAFKNVDGNVSMALDLDKVDWLAKKDELEKMGYTKNNNDSFSNYVDLKNVSNIKFVGCGAFGHDFWNESKVLFLTNDGIIKYETFENVVKNNISLKTVNGLKNIVQLYACSVVDVDNGERMGGAMTTIAVDENGIAYDLNEYMK